ncbi:MAG: hypothetical protein J7500_12110 [Sphingomonas sp.]|uniref:hypothetical protein n=1 Tax=Sphingomonas sp. TaxID=28214 RepID=UPI001B1DD87E|nr:hypothetical protein [Sphingomonas sp.]MBO9623445.1 hypothetical protein [Sphingomonas sp.]
MPKTIRARLAGCAFAALAMACAQTAQAAPGAEKEGSLYLQCDGEPNNMTGGETAARLLGAVTLLGLFAPRVESADSSKRKLAADGVAACTGLIDGDKKEGNPERRVRLILGRAVHQIEAKDYAAALADVQRARSEAASAGLLADAYYAHSQTRAFDLVEATALHRMGKPDEARVAALRSIGSGDRSLLGLTMPNYLFTTASETPGEREFLRRRTRSAVVIGGLEAERLEELGEFARAAEVREALVAHDKAVSTKNISSIWLAEAAVTNAIAGNADRAATLAADARANFEKRKAEGKPEANAAEYVELMDLYGIVRMTADGDAAGARRLFAARSEWVAASFGCVVEMARRLRQGAPAADLIGGLARDPATLWSDRAAARTAVALANDSDNRTLFGLLPAYHRASAYEAVSKQVWRTDKSQILLKGGDPEKRATSMETLYLYAVSPNIALEAYTLHAALLARSRGHQGFVITPLIASGVIGAMIHTGNRGDAGMSEPLFNDAAEVIAELSPLFPDPETLKARKAARTK